MKKVFNASILAAAVALSFGANAAQILVQPANKMELSAEGISVGATVATKAITFDTVLDAQHSGTTSMVVTLGSKVDLTGVLGGSCAAATAGVFACGDVTFNVGTGNFTFDTVAIDATKGTVTYTVSLGNTITAGSSFRTTIGGTNLPVISGAFDASFASTLAGVAVDSGKGNIASEVQQYATVVSTNLDAVIERVARVSFNGTTATKDTLVLSFTDLAEKTSTTITALPTSKVINVTLFGDFSDENGTGVWVAAPGASAVTGVVSSDKKSVSFSAVPVPASFDAKGTGSITVEFTVAGTPTKKLLGSDFTASVDVIATGPTGSKTYNQLTKAAAGHWVVDGAIVNVPYLPIGYGLSPNVEIANNSAAAVKSSIIIEGYSQGATVGDAAITVYPAVTLPFKAPGKTVTKVSEADIKAAFGIADTDKRKLSVTFNIDANPADVTLAPYYRENESRVNVMSDQYKGK